MAAIPARDAKTSRQTGALTIQTLARSLSPGARKEIQQIIGREIGEAAGVFGR